MRSVVAPRAGSRRHRMWKIELDLLLCVSLFCSRACVCLVAKGRAESQEGAGIFRTQPRHLSSLRHPSQPEGASSCFGVICKEGREQHLGNNLGNDGHLSLSLLFLLKNPKNEPDCFVVLGHQAFMPTAHRRKTRNLKS